MLRDILHQFRSDKCRLIYRSLSISRGTSGEHGGNDTRGREKCLTGPRHKSPITSRILTESLAFLSLLFIPSPAYAQSTEGITHFSSDITIEKDTSITIDENIPYFTSAEKHGIYRYIPVKYSVNGLNFTTSISGINVTDSTGQPIQYTRSFESGNVNLKIGDPDRTFHGDKTYLISYQVSDVLRRFDDHDELYWDITGEGWQIPITQTIAVIHSPFATINRVECYSGEFGLDNKLCHATVVDGHTVQITYDQQINYGDNLTVAIALDQEGSQIVFPSDWQRLVKAVRDNFIGFLVIIPIVVMFYLWYTRGRDQVFISDNIFDNDTHKATKLKPLFSYNRTPMVYQPLTHLTPGEAGTILDERVDNQDIIAEIIDLARQKFLIIEPTKKTGLIFKKADYLFTKKRTATAGLPKHQEYLLEQIFKSGDTVKLSDLKGEFYTAMQKTKTYIYDSATDKKLFTSNPNHTRGAYIALGILMLAVAFGISVIYLNQGVFLPFVITIIQSPFVVLLGFFMVQKSAVGNNFYLQAKGLKHTIQVGAWRQKINEKNLFIEEVLPFAISLGVVDKLVHDMDKLNLKPPEYLAPSLAATHGFNTGQFINGFAAQAASNLSYNPSSSSYSGGSGFSGGSSGGGGGGGGGGSW